MRAKLLFVPVNDEALKRLCRQATFQRRRPQDEAAVLIERALGLRHGSAQAENHAEADTQGAPDDAA